MEKPLRMSFRGLEPTEAIKEAIQERANKLETFYDKILGCEVMVEVPHRRHSQGNIYHLRVRVTVPGSEIVVSRDPAEHASHEDLLLAVNDAFKETARQLEDYVRRRRGQVKRRVEPTHARVVRLFEDEGYGFLETTDGRELYFHRNSVLKDGFGQLRLGTEVRVAEEEGDKGPQASTVTIVGHGSKRHQQVS